MNLNLTRTEQWDVVTLGLLTAMWAVMLFYELKQTWQWDALGRALTALTACLMLSYGLTTANILSDGDFYPPVIRWVVRTVLFTNGMITIFIMVRDRRRDEAERRRP